MSEGGLRSFSSSRAEISLSLAAGDAGRLAQREANQEPRSSHSLAFSEHWIRLN